MRIYNGTNSLLDLPLTVSQRISIPPKSVSGNIVPSSEFLSLLTSSFKYDQLALIISGPYELNLCSSVSGSVGFVVHSLDEAIEKFNPQPEVGCNCSTEDKTVCSGDNCKGNCDCKKGEDEEDPTKTNVDTPPTKKRGRRSTKKANE